MVRWQVGREQELAPSDCGEGGLYEGKLGGDGCGVAVLSAVEDPGYVTDRELLHSFADYVAREVARAVVPGCSGLSCYCEFLDGMPELGNVSQYPFLGEGSDDLYDLLEIIFAWEGDHVGLMTCFGHQPEPHLGYDSEVALAEDAVDCWTVCMLERLPRGIICAIFSGQSAHSSPEEAAIWENYFHATVVGKVVAVWSVSIFS